jgi:hypothetical protein
MAIAGGRYHSLALRSDGSVVGWGRDDNGQATPLDGSDYVGIAAGGWHCLAVCAAIPGDFDIDGDVNSKDFSILASAWSTESGDARYNSKCNVSIPADNRIDSLDLAVLVEYWLASLRL